MPTVLKREAAGRDLVDHFVYLAENASLDVAERFLTQAEASFLALAGQPKMGAPLTLKHLDLAGMRKWRVKDFDNHLIFHQPRPERRVDRARAACGHGLVDAPRVQWPGLDTVRVNILYRPPRLCWAIKEGDHGGFREAAARETGMTGLPARGQGAVLRSAQTRRRVPGEMGVPVRPDRDFRIPAPRPQSEFLCH